MTSLLVWCPACMAVKGHVVDGQEMGCSGCGMVCVGGRGFARVALATMRVATVAEDMEPCKWCCATKPRIHDCVGDPTPCPDRRPDGSTCGMCGVCVPTQDEYLKRAAEAEDLRRYGTPGDLADTP